MLNVTLSVTNPLSIVRLRLSCVRVCGPDMRVAAGKCGRHGHGRHQSGVDVYHHQYRRRQSRRGRDSGHTFQRMFVSGPVPLCGASTDVVVLYLSQGVFWTWTAGDVPGAPLVASNNIITVDSSNKVGAVNIML